MENQSRHDAEKRRKPPVAGVRHLPRFGITDFSSGGEWKFFHDLNDKIPENYFVMSTDILRIVENIKVHIRDLSEVDCCPDAKEEKDQLLDRFFRTFLRG
jgi:hypothetical protein